MVQMSDWRGKSFWSTLEDLIPPCWDQTRSRAQELARTVDEHARHRICAAKLRSIFWVFSSLFKALLHDQTILTNSALLAPCPVTYVPSNACHAPGMRIDCAHDEDSAQPVLTTR